MGNELDLTNDVTLITGATGFLGRSLVTYANSKNYVSRATVHNRSLDSGIDEINIDIREKSQVIDLIQTIRPRAILHLAAAGVTHGTADIHEMLRVNALGLCHLLDASSSLTTRPHVVIAGTCIEYANKDSALTEDDPIYPSSAYGASKAAAFSLAQFYAQRLPITWLRVFNTYGPHEPFPRLVPYIIHQIRNHEEVHLTAGSQVRDFVYVDDVAEAFWRFASLPPRDASLRVVNIGRGIPVSIRVFVNTLLSILDDSKLTSIVRFGSKPYRPNEPMYLVADISRMKSLLDWSPSTSLEMGLRKVVEVALEQT